MNKQFRFLILVIMTIIVIFFLSGYFFKAENVKVFIVSEKMNLKEVVKENGIVESKQIFAISPAFDGEIYAKVKLGDKVEKGQVLAQLDAEDIKSSIMQLDAQIKSVKAQTNITGASNPQSKEFEIQKIKIDTLKRNFDKSQEDYNRIKSLYDSGVSSKVELENSENTLKAMEDEIKSQEELLYTMKANSDNMKTYYSGQLQALQAQRDLLLSKKGRTQISAPISGIITAIHIKDMQKVNSVMNIMEISSIENKIVSSQLASEVAADLKIGDSAEIIYETKHQKKIFNGKISYISPYSSTQLSSLGIEEQKTKVETTFVELNEIPLGYKLDVNFITLDKPNVISIPKLSTFKIEEDYFVFTIKDQKLVKQKILKGTETSDKYEILEGLNKGDIVLFDPNTKNVKEGSKVTY